MAATVTKWRGVWCRLLLINKTLKPRPIKPPSRNISSLVPNPNTPRFFLPSIHPRLFSSPVAAAADDDGDDGDDIKDPIQELLAELEREKQRERDQKTKAGTPIVDDEDEEDYMGVQPLIDKLEKSKTKYIGPLELYEEPTDSESDDEDDERFTGEAINKDIDLFEKKHERHGELLKNFVDAETLEEGFKWMEAIDKFEQKHLRLPLEYRVIGDMLNRLKDASGKDRFMLLQKLNRAIRRVQWKEAYDPDNPANYGIIEHEEVGPSADTEDVAAAGDDEEKKELLGGLEDDEENFDEDKDTILLEKLNAIDKKLEEKLALLENTFGKKGRVLEEEIKDLADERTALTEISTQPRYRKGFDVRLIDVNRTCKVTKGGQVISFTAMVACGNYNGVVGFAKAKAPTVPVALQKAYEKCFQNLHFVERHEEHTIAHAVQTKYKKTKVYLWPASTRTGMKASKTVQIILNLAGYKNIKSKVIGSRNPHNTVKAVFKALNSIETPKDVQEKFGRTVVESYLL